MTPASTKFNMANHNNTVIITLAEALDFEMASYYEFTLTVLDSGSQVDDQAMLRLNITNVDDNVIKFTSVYHSFSVSENSPLGTSVGSLVVIDMDANPNVTYEISGPTVPFKIIKTGDLTASVVVNGPIDRESTSTYNLDVTASEGGTSATTRVYIIITDVNDVPPVFRESTAAYNHRIPEDLTSGVFILIPEIVDADLTSTPYYTYDYDNVTFLIDPLSGKITIGDIDREAKEFHTFTITYSDGVFVTTQQINITLYDVNDERPVFQNFPDILNVAENLAVGSQVTTFTATDLDTAPNAIIRYQMVGIEPDTSRFTLYGTTGELTLKEALDYETKSSHTLTISAYNIHNTTGILVEGTTSESKQITINVFDVDDSPPRFSQDHYEVTVFDIVPIGYEILLLTASDPDGPQSFQYSIVYGNEDGLFQLNPGTGSLKVEKLLKDSSNQYLNISVITAVGIPPGYCMVSVTVIRDNTTVFPQAEYSVTIEENKPPQLLLNLSLSLNPDESNITFVDESNYDKFILNRSSGDLSTKLPLNYEDGSLYHLQIEVTNGRFTSRMTVIVTVVDIDDEIPVMLSPITGEITVSENAEPGSMIGYIVASDPDTPSLSFTISLYPPVISPARRRRRAVSDFPFRIDSFQQTGYIILTSSLDASVHNQYVVLINILNIDGFPSLAEPINRTIAVKDTNDNVPVFNQTSYQFQAREDLEVGAVVGQVGATDRDLNTTLRYLFLGSQQVFEMNSNSGEIILRTPLDFETTKIYNLVVMAIDAVDSSPLAGFANVSIKVEGIFEFHPVFVGPFSYNLLENTPLGRVFNVRATSKDDCDPPCSMAYTSPFNPYFDVISSIGDVVLKKPLNTSDFQSTTLTITATWGDSPPSHAFAIDFTINVIDVNDNVPRFDQDQYEAAIPESSLLGSSIAIVRASDADPGQNGEIRYRIISHHQNPSPFVINTVTGQLVRYIGLFDYESTKEYGVIIEAYDLGNVSLSSTCLVVVSILDANDNLPIFRPLNYLVSVPDDAPIGYTIVQVLATDKDDGDFGRLHYQLFTEHSEFGINQTTGFIFVNSSLASNIARTFKMNVSAVDEGGLMSNENATVTVNLFLEGVGAPKFNRSVYVFEVAENITVDGVLTIGQVLVTDSDSSSLHLELSPPDSSLLFSISQNGDFFVHRQLDYEQQQSYVMTVKASDDASPPHVDFAQIIINVLDEDDELPIFLTPTQISVSVSEHTHLGQHIAFIQGKDLDNASYPLKFTLLTHTDMFTLQSGRGHAIVILSTPLNCTQASMELRVKLEDAGGKKALTETNIQVNVLDVNDHCPVFTDLVYHVEIIENNINTTFFYVKDDDCTSHNNGTVRYGLAGPYTRISIDPDTGLAQFFGFDYENETESQFTVTVSDVNKPSCRSTALVYVKVINVNDNYPRIISPSTFSILEDQAAGSTVMRVEAEDDDKGQYGELTYSIVESTYSQYFRILQDGSIVLTKSLDRESTSSMNIQVVVKDAGDESTFQLIIVQIEDVNDNKPIFTREKYQFTIDEEFPGDIVVGCVSVTDKDQGLNAEVRYRIFNSTYSESFEIHNNGCIYTSNKSIDVDLAFRKHRLFKEITLFVTAIDSGTPVLESSAVVTININDVNDNAPKFEEVLITRNILESLQIESLVANVVATDKDYKDTITYSIISGNEAGMFVIDQETGELRLNKTLDHGQTSVYHISIQASDGLKISAMPCNLTIHVINVDDNQPTFQERNYTLSLPENTPVGPSVLVRLSAVDKDGDIMVYSFADSEDAQFFAMNASTGEVTLVQQLDFELKRVHVLIANARSQNEQNHLVGTASVVVKVLDANDHRPVITSYPQMPVNISEDTKIGTSIVHVSAKDKDSGMNGAIEYKIVGYDVYRQGEEAECEDCLLPFAIDGNDGNIFVTSLLDTETYRSYVIGVHAIDLASNPRLSLTKWITIVLQDSNEHCPVFDRSQYQAFISEDTSPGFSILRIQARDSDIYSDSLNYTLDGSDFFEIDSFNGSLILKNTLPDYNEVKVHEFFVFASDQSNPPCITRAPVTVFITNINTHPPTISGPFHYRVLENAIVGDLLFTVNAQDTDDDVLNYKMGYLNNSRASFTTFTIDFSSGEVLLVSKLDFESQQYYKLEVIVSDGKFAVSVVYNITVIGVNDNEPKFSRSHYIFNIPEESPAETSCGCVLGSDAEGGALYYNMTYLRGSHTQGIFRINSTTGCIYTLSPLDREQYTRHYLTAYVFDTGVPVLTDIATIEVVLEDINDNTPLVSNIPSDLYLSEETHVPTSLFPLQASDRDSGDNANVFFRWTGDKSMFAYESGQIWLTKKLDYEKVSK